MKKYIFILACLFFTKVFCANILAQTSIYAYTGAVQTYTVPPGVESLTVDARGGCGGSSEDDDYPSLCYSRGGYGGRVLCSLAVTPGQVLYVYVGGNGDSSNLDLCTGGGTGLGGWNGGAHGRDSMACYGNLGGGGGGATDIRTGGAALTNRVIVAGGGGGGSYSVEFGWAGGCSGTNYDRGGDGGGLTGESGWYCDGDTTAWSGSGGTQTSGGTGGTGPSPRCITFVSGTLGLGGYNCSGQDAGGGGGGGYYGGGAGYFVGGGGGSSYADSTLTTSVIYTQGYNTTGADTVFITVNCSGGIINGIDSVCTGSIVSLSDTVAGSSGLWSSSNVAIAIVGSTTGIVTGTVTGTSASTATITYSATISCGSVYSIATITVNPLPDAGVIAGTPNVCTGDSISLFVAVTGGIWSSSPTSIAAVDRMGIVTGVSAGTATISYSVTNICGTAMATQIITVDPLSIAGSISGFAEICMSSTTALSDSITGGAWSSSNTSIATVGSPGIVYGVSSDTATINYSVTNSCGTEIAAQTVTVNPLPNAGIISGIDSLCANDTTTLKDTIIGGVWGSSNHSIALISASGLTMGILPGIDTITYTVTINRCISTAIFPFVVSPLSDCPSGVNAISYTGLGPINVNPNPNNGVFTLLLSSAIEEQATVTISNLFGEKIEETTIKSNKTVVMTLGQPSGLYIISVNAADRLYIGKVIIIR